MRLVLLAVLGTAALATATTAALGQSRIALNGLELDGVTPGSLNLPSPFQLRIMVEELAASDPDRTKDAILEDEFDASLALMDLAEMEEPQGTPARKAFLALIGLGEISGPESANLETDSLAGLTVGGLGSRPEAVQPTSLDQSASTLPVLQARAIESRPATIMPTAMGPQTSTARSVSVTPSPPQQTPAPRAVSTAPTPSPATVVRQVQTARVTSPEVSKPAAARSPAPASRSVQTVSVPAPQTNRSVAATPPVQSVNSASSRAPEIRAPQFVTQFGPANASAMLRQVQSTFNRMLGNLNSQAFGPRR